MSNSQLFFPIFIFLRKLRDNLVQHDMGNALHHLALLLLELVEVLEHLSFLRADDLPLGNLEHPQLQVFIFLNLAAIFNLMLIQAGLVQRHLPLLLLLDES